MADVLITFYLWQEGARCGIRGLDSSVPNTEPIREKLQPLAHRSGVAAMAVVMIRCSRLLRLFGSRNFSIMLLGFRGTRFTGRLDWPGCIVVQAREVPSSRKLQSKEASSN